MEQNTILEAIFWKAMPLCTTRGSQISAKTPATLTSATTTMSANSDKKKKQH